MVRRCVKEQLGIFYLLETTGRSLSQENTKFLSPNLSFVAFQACFGLEFITTVSFESIWLMVQRKWKYGQLEASKLCRRRQWRMLYVPVTPPYGVGLGMWRASVETHRCRDSEWMWDGSLFIDLRSTLPAPWKWKSWVPSNIRYRLNWTSGLGHGNIVRRLRGVRRVADTASTVPGMAVHG